MTRVSASWKSSSSNSLKDDTTESDQHNAQGIPSLLLLLGKQSCLLSVSKTTQNFVHGNCQVCTSMFYNMKNHNAALDMMSADNDKGQHLCVANPEEWKTNLATARPTFASPHNKRRRKKLAVFKGMETSHELFLNGQTNALHLHIMNGPYYSKSKCRLWDKAGCWMLIWDQEASDEGIGTFLPHSNRT